MSRAFSRADLIRAASKAAPGSVLHELVAKHAAPRDLEHPEQVKLFAWREANAETIPELRLLYAIPNFSGRGASKHVRLRDGARLKAEGRRKGMLDTCLPVGRGGFHALYLEIKAERSLTPEQRWWIRELSAAGNRALMVRGFEAARDEILSYLSLT